MPYTLAYQDRYRRVIENVFTRDSTGVVPFASIPDETPTKITYEWTGRQFTKLLSAVMVGADLAFPEEADDIIFDLIKGVHLPPDVDPDGEGCVEYLPSASFIKFYPDNPFVSGDTSAGWNKEAWFLFPQFDTLFPDWLDNWLNGLLTSLTNYQATDVLFNIESIPINPIDAFLNGGGILPKIEIKFSGSGHINITLLSFPLGGKAVIELDQEPNILDLLTGGILDPGAFMVELNRDVINFPPDEYPIIQIPIDVTTTGNHTLYIVFIPIVDDELFPTGFGGGLRSVELCGFPEQGTMGIEQIVWDGCQLKSITGGVETVIVTAAQIEACLDIPPSGGGGGAAALSVKSKSFQLSSAVTNNTQSYTDALIFSHTPSRANMLVIWDNATLANSAGAGEWLIRTQFNGLNGQDAIEVNGTGTGNRETQISDWFSGLTVGVAHDLKLQFRSATASNTVTLGQGLDVMLTIIEFDDVSQLFVEDIRIFEGELQKKIGGIWLNVTDSFEAIINSIQATANAALTTANNAQTIANNAYTLAQTADNKASNAQTVNNTQNTRLNTLESDVDDLELSVGQHQLTLDNHESRIDALEAAASGGSSWGGYKFGAITHLEAVPSFGYYSTTNVYQSSSPIGWLPDAGNQVEVRLTNGMRYGSAVHVRVQVEVLGGSGDLFYGSVNDGEEQVLVQSTTSGNRSFAWINVPATPTTEMKIVVRNALSNQLWTLKGATILFLVINPLTGVLLP